MPPEARNPNPKRLIFRRSGAKGGQEATGSRKFGSSIEFQIGAASACFTAVTAFGLAAGVRLLPRRTAAW
ncbi:hypothetical protein FQP90_08245 [Paenarthrobacter nitroguajacolicus]|uniref:Uncharacterized protein n=1 Tax=Paenarthrobacter nitroguajacolicus TaxID=211146 RepID=A0A558H4C2_PAENT|nr:hypothetical protein FQP90_08245 [Paenarthrobacter nitroguajacolicus]